jgi:hypothetical protein
MRRISCAILPYAVREAECCMLYVLPKEYDDPTIIRRVAYSVSKSVKIEVYFGDHFNQALL